jgi:hypothetical protein
VHLDLSCTMFSNVRGFLTRTQHSDCFHCWKQR